MFGNKGYLLKLVAALGLIALQGWAGAQWGYRINPGLWRCVSRPDPHHGMSLWLPGNVLARTSEGFLFESGGATVEVRGEASVEPGTGVQVTGTFDREGPHIRLKEVRPASPYAGYRRVSEWISIGVFLLILYNFGRHFSFHPDRLQAKGTG